MRSFSNYSGIATTVVDLTTELSPLLIGLVGLVGLWGAMIALSALHYYLSQRVQPTPQATLTTPNHRAAA
jgi:hypothetical protein